MSLSDIGLRKQIRSWFFADPKFEVPQLEHKEKRCEEIFGLLTDCVQRHGWNDNQCQVTIKPKYERCVIKRVSFCLSLLGQNEDLVNGAWFDLINLTKMDEKMN